MKAAVILAVVVVGVLVPGAPAQDRAPEAPQQESLSIVLGRPTDRSVAVSLLASEPREGYLEYGSQAGVYTARTDVAVLPAGAPVEMTLDGLTRDTQYVYRLQHRRAGAVAFSAGCEGRFHTQRAPGGTFTFTVTADSHLDKNTDPAVYARTLRSALADRPDFHIDLGDTFMTGKRRDRPGEALPPYLAQRHYFGQLCHSAPLFLALGNHDGEFGGPMDAATGMRMTYFPNPVPDGFYTGGPNQNYSAWHWGDALFVVLDPFRYSTRPRRGPEGADNWGFTLGRPQYDWLQKTLESSPARFKFVFTHHLVGGRDRQGRGGVEAAPFFEWGGHEWDGRDTFAENRPGWPMPIHALLVKHGVTAVFHGHDHFFARQELDGVVYQLVPQPGHPGEGSIGQAGAYGYVGGDMRSGAGYLRVQVASAETAVAYVRTGNADHSRAPATNTIACRYTIRAHTEGGRP